MPSELTITAKGQVTLRQSVLKHLGLNAGHKVGVSLLPDGRVELRAASKAGNVSEVRGALHRPGQQTVSLEEMQEAITRGRNG
jgi:bifunctional DNA-binding transcriptional regulator/antitoxin component of YhaV-PrlF toxin-antitoxin module